MIWITSDLHFNHENMIKSGLRPKDYEKKILKSWKTHVKDSDIVIILGDICWHNNYRVFSKLSGRKIVTRGNHCSKSSEALMSYFDFVCDTFTLKFRGTSIVFSHKPLRDFPQELNIHGHLHDKETIKDGKHVLISLEKMGYGVFSLQSIVKKWKEGHKDGKGLH